MDFLQVLNLSLQWVGHIYTWVNFFLLQSSSIRLDFQLPENECFLLARKKINIASKGQNTEYSQIKINIILITRYSLDLYWVRSL